MSVKIRAVEENDIAAIAHIYNYYIRETTITFEFDEMSYAAMKNRVFDIASTYPYLVIEEAGKVRGFAYASQWRKRCAYNDAVESSVYLGHDQVGKGLGRALYQALIDTLREKGYHTVIGGITIPNEASLALHESLGFKKVAHFKEVGFKFEKRLDVGYWQLAL